MRIVKLSELAKAIKAMIQKLRFMSWLIFELYQYHTSDDWRESRRKVYAKYRIADTC
jgi:phage antirepressor YoqD-like protein